MDIEMNKKNQHPIDFGLLKDFFYFNHNKLIIVASTIIVVSIYLYFLRIPKLNILPGVNKYKFAFYTDIANGGKSKIIKKIVSDKFIYFEFDLKEGFLSPFVGLSIVRKKDSIINISYYNRLCLDIEGNRIYNIDVSLFNRNTLEKFPTSTDELGFHSNFEISHARKRYYINLAQLKIPDWMRDINNISLSKELKPDLKHILNFNIANAYTAVLGNNLSLKIYAISFERNNSELIIFLITAELIVLLCLIIVHYIRGYLRKKTVSVTIAYKSVDIEIETHQLKSFLTYINSNFHDNTLTLEHVSKYTGINHRHIAISIQQTFNCNFKTYVNQIRINEAKRLLIESELNVGEISFKVGFINQSHFNRVFKNLVGMNPSDFRENKL